MDKNQVRLASEYRAQQARERRDYREAIAHLRVALDAAEKASDSWDYCRLTIDLALLQYDLGSMDECIATMEALVADDRIHSYPDFSVRTRAILSQAFRTKGDTERALMVAEDAAAVLPKESKEVRLPLQYSLVSALAEEGDVEAAWQEALVLATLLGPQSSAKVKGSSYWVIGNAAFLSGRIDEGREFHRQAASVLVSVGDVNVWALFNKASANLRLEAGLVEPETLECVERAEVAISVTEGIEEDMLEILLVRARWEFAAGNLDDAEMRFRELVSKASGTFPNIQANALMLLAESLVCLGRQDEALRTAEEALQIFEELNTGVRAAQVRSFIATHSSDWNKGRPEQAGNTSEKHDMNHDI